MGSKNDKCLGTLRELADNLRDYGVATCEDLRAWERGEAPLDTTNDRPLREVYLGAHRRGEELTPPLNVKGGPQRVLFCKLPFCGPRVARDWYNAGFRTLEGLPFNFMLPDTIIFN